MTPDEIVAEIFRVQTERDPKGDPGDLSIDIQDDSAMHAVWQNGEMIGMGNSIQTALESALMAVIDKRPPIMPPLSEKAFLDLLNQLNPTAELFDQDT